MRLILASASKTRAQLLRSAGLEAEVIPSGVDEEEIKASLLAENAPARHIAEVLAELKAVKVSRDVPGTLVIGSDQVLEVRGQIFSKPQDMGEASAQLERFSGEELRLPTAIVVAEQGAAVWRHVSEPRVKMRAYSASFITDYLRQAGSDALASVGGFQVEGLGAQLTERIDGEFFAVLGLPLLPLLRYLRDRKVIPS